MMTITATTTDRHHSAPAFPAAFGALDGTDTLGQYAMIAGHLDTLRKAYAKHTRWLEACTLYSLGGATPNLRSNPSKDAKHRMYGAAGSLVRACGWATADNTRCMNLDDIAVLIATVESVYRGH